MHSAILCGVLSYVMMTNRLYTLIAGALLACASASAGTYQAEMLGTTAVPLQHAGRVYSNIHKAVFPGGEIRGLLAPIPEPTTMVLLTAGLGALGLVRRRKLAARG